MPRRERTLRDSVTHHLKSLNAIAVENPILPGTPDVNYVEGWIELKSWERWPVHPRTVLRMDHWTPQQRVFHLRRSRAGGRTHVLLSIEETHDFLLLDGKTAATILGKATQSQLREFAVGQWSSRAECMAGLLKILSGSHPGRPTLVPVLHEQPPTQP